MSKYEYFIFDWDGCLAKTLEVWLNAYKTTYAAFNVNPTDREIAHHFGDWAQQEQFGITDSEKFNSILIPTVEVGLKTVPLYAGAKELLVALKDQPVALVSTSTHRILDPAIERHGIAKYFDIILTGDDVTEHKPSPEGINKALDALGGTPQKAVMIGDSRKDLGAAVNAGVDSLLLYPPEHEIFYDLAELKTYHPTHIAHNFAEAEKILL